MQQQAQESQAEDEADQGDEEDAQGSDSQQCSSYASGGANFTVAASPADSWLPDESPGNIQLTHAFYHLAFICPTVLCTTERAQTQQLQRVD